VRCMCRLKLKEHGIDMRGDPRLMDGDDQMYGFKM